jgi:hypothetical protein
MSRLKLNKVIKVRFDKSTMLILVLAGDINPTVPALHLAGRRSYQKFNQVIEVRIEKAYGLSS